MVTKIDSREQFKDLSIRPDEKYILTSDITVEDTRLAVLFYGILDGNNHTIKNLNDKTHIIEENRGKIKNLKVKNPKSEYKGSTGVDDSLFSDIGRTGGICVSNKGTIENCHVSGTLISGKNIGGIIGENLGIIKDCRFKGTVESKKGLAGGIVANNGTGRLNRNRIPGLAGDIVANNVKNGTVKKCSTVGNVKSVSVTGGIVGRNKGKVSDSYFNGDLDMENKTTGYIVGVNDNKINNCHSIVENEEGPLIGEENGMSDNNSFRKTAKNIKKAIIVNKI